MRILYQLTSPMEKALGGEEILRRKQVLESNANAGTEVDVRSIPSGPGSIESAYDAALVVPEVLTALADAEKEHFDAAIIGCFSDPGIDAARELVSMPVIGPGASALYLASQIGSRFTIISPGPGVRIGARLRALGLADNFASVRSISMTVLDLAQQRNSTLERIADAGRQAANEDGADVLVLGCMSMAFLDITEELQELTAIPVVNPVLASLHMAETLISMGLTHSRAAYHELQSKQIF